MFIGHFAVALGAKKYAPQVSSGGSYVSDTEALVTAGLLD